MNRRYFLSFVFLIATIACEKKEDSSNESSFEERIVASRRAREGISPTETEQAAQAAPVQKREICVPSIQGVSPQDVPRELRVYCDTKEPLDPAAFRSYMARLNSAAAEAQQEIAARQQAMQATGDSRLAGIQQQQDGCTYRYPGIFPQDGPLAGMCANSQAEIDAYLRNQGMAQEARDNRQMDQINANAAMQCRKICRMNGGNVSLCLAGCPTN